ncbi:DUF1667 domain-containing protein [Clostridium sp. CF011]|uniref:DUF1667 domain-containing protein n=1 Tax=unclassified Clostridium TaxID=2614128 RepID=UPI001C0D9497|nr:MULTISPECIES: DUF1667 domain-containing protein [unclassified Clostridium]MBU3092024.1 DUF1667 domain-containing protein [Clostridium sp. CF011]MBW9145451.1 DUF1667 domain-containing protein [Clostridium sp. CM027]UVE42292.1 DUF1667 domain-containing protein [Clostridium sp. CM027]WAG71309.1 DUF1667 domain-containing protein [Clostridium sp. CF011]
MNREMTCIVCPNGCELTLELEENIIKNVTGASCKKGIAYATQEIQNPKRTISSLVKVNNGEMPLVSVRTTTSIPKNRIFDVMKEIKNIEADAPIEIEQVIINNVLGLGVDIIATKSICKK